MKANKGYTLIEILIVIVIISIVSTIALLTIGRNQHRRIESLANQLTQMLTLAEEQAMLQPGVLGLSLTDKTITFMSYAATDNTKSMQWIPVDDKTLQQHVIPEGITVTVSSSANALSDKNSQSDQDEAQIQPQIIISPNGDVTPFTMSLSKEGDAPLYVIKGEADGTITNQLQE